MGTQRVGTLPDTQPWRRVVRLIAESADAGAVATATTTAALNGLEQARDDEGLIYTFYLLARTARAAKSDAFAETLRDEGLAVPDELDVFQLTAAFADVVDRHLGRRRGRTDFGEMAELAAIESLASLLGGKAATLFDTQPPSVDVVARRFGRDSGFAALAHDFFARFVRRFLDYHLGRVLPLHVGPNCRFADPEEHNQFLGQLETHCREVAGIVTGFASDWYRKGNAPGGPGITRRRAAGFVAHAITKLSGELTKRGKRDV
jgi:hypothetical protein